MLGSCMWIRIEPVREIWVDRIFPMKREIFGLIRGVTMAMGVLWIPSEEKGRRRVTLSLLFNTTQNFPGYWHFSQRHDAARRACERERGVHSEYSWIREWVEWLRFLSWLHLHSQLSPTKLTFTQKWNGNLGQMFYPALSDLKLLMQIYSGFFIYHSLCIRIQLHL